LIAPVKSGMVLKEFRALRCPMKPIPLKENEEPIYFVFLVFLRASVAPW